MARHLLVAWLAALALLALLPLSATPPDTDRAWIQPLPLATIMAAATRGLTTATLVSVVGNVVAFVPLGLLAPAALPAVRGWIAAALLGAGVSLAVEIAQLAIGLAAGFPYRMTDVDDVLLNVLGTLAGFAAWRFAQRRGASSA
jgi:glycopeptide antibiotics resistance protein